MWKGRVAENDSEALVIPNPITFTGAVTVGGITFNGVASKDANGAITIAPYTVKLIKASAGAYTIADPTTAQEGIRILITAQTAQAHTVSNTGGSGFNAGGASAIKATFGGAIGDCMEIVAINGKWNVVLLKNVTLGTA
jgi:hypothetical protein